MIETVLFLPNDTTYINEADCNPENIGVFEEISINGNNCDSIEITIISLLSPNECLLEGIITGNVIPCEENLGNISLTITSGIAPFTFEFTGESTGTGTISNLNETLLIPDLPAGDYNIVVMDSNDMIINYTVQTEQLFPPEAIANIEIDIVCFDEMNGSLLGSAVGGQAPYFYEWSNSATSAAIDHLNAGTYTLSVPMQTIASMRPRLL